MPPIQHGEWYQASSSLPIGTKTLSLNIPEKKDFSPLLKPEGEF